MIAAKLLNELSKLTAIPNEGTTYAKHGIHPYAANAFTGKILKRPN